MCIYQSFLLESPISCCCICSFIHYNPDMMKQYNVRLIWGNEKDTIKNLWFNKQHSKAYCVINEWLMIHKSLARRRRVVSKHEKMTFIWHLIVLCITTNHLECLWKFIIIVCTALTSKFSFLSWNTQIKLQKAPKLHVQYVEYSPLQIVCKIVFWRYEKNFSCNTIFVHLWSKLFGNWGSGRNNFSFFNAYSSMISDDIKYGHFYRTSNETLASYIGEHNKWFFP